MQWICIWPIKGCAPMADEQDEISIPKSHKAHVPMMCVIAHHAWCAFLMVVAELGSAPILACLLHRGITEWRCWWTPSVATCGIIAYRTPSWPCQRILCWPPNLPIRPECFMDLGKFSLRTMAIFLSYMYHGKKIRDHDQLSLGTMIN